MTVQRIPIADRDSWLAARRNDITASDIAAICGIDPFKSPKRVYAEKLGLIPPEDENNAMRRGRWFEPAVMQAISEIRPTWRIMRSGVYLRDPDLRIGATPDVAAIDPERDGFGNIQVKVIALRKFNAEWKGSDEDAGEDDDYVPGNAKAPLGYQVQTITEANMMGASWAKLAALVVGEFTAELYFFEVELLPEAWEKIKSEATFFWDCIENRREPPLDPERDGSTLKAMFPREKYVTPINLAAHNDLPSLLVEREECKARMATDKARKGTIETIIKDKMRDNGYASLPGWGITWLQQDRKEFITPAGSSRPLRITKKKG